MVLKRKENTENENKVHQRARQLWEGMIVPPNPRALLGTSWNTRRYHTTVRTTFPTRSGNHGSGGGGHLKKRTSKVVSGGDTGNSSDNSDSDPSVKQGELPKVKITSNKLLAK